MCGLLGLVGYAGHETNLTAALTQLTAVTVWRGWDSTGLAKINHYGKTYDIYKKAMQAQCFVDMRRAASILSDANSASAIIGHTRAATRGSVCEANAHPFYNAGKYGSNVLAHNGYVEDWDTKAHNVDSDWAGKMLAEHGPDYLEELRGDYALTWFDFATNTMNMARNRGRPLHVASIRAGTSQKKVWGSEAEMLQLALRRNGIIPLKMYSLAENVLYRFDPATSALIERKPYVTKPKKVISYPVSTATTYGSWRRAPAATVPALPPAPASALPPAPPRKPMVDLPANQIDHFHQGCWVKADEENELKACLVANPTQLNSVGRIQVNLGWDKTFPSLDEHGSKKYGMRVTSGPFMGRRAFLRPTASLARNFIDTLHAADKGLVAEVIGMRWNEKIGVEYLVCALTKPMYEEFTTKQQAAARSPTKAEDLVDATPPTWNNLAAV